MLGLNLSKLFADNQKGHVLNAPHYYFAVPCFYARDKRDSGTKPVVISLECVPFTFWLTGQRDSNVSLCNFVPCVPLSDIVTGQALALA